MAEQNVKTISDVQAFFIELMRRFVSKSPKFFQVINWITGFCTLVLGVPALVGMINAQMHWNLELPMWWENIQNGSVALITLGAWLTSNLTVNKKVVDTDSGTQAVAANKEDVKPLPFTTKKEAGQ